MSAERSALFERLHTTIAGLPVINAHEHMAGPAHMPRPNEPISALMRGYVGDDVLSSGVDRVTLDWLLDDAVATDDKWQTFEPIWQRMEFTAYARVTKLILRDVYGVEAMSRSGLARVAEQLPNRDEAFYWRILDEANIRLVLTDTLGRSPADFGAFLRGEQTFPDRLRHFIPLPRFHVVSHYDHSARDWDGVQQIGQWADRHITSLAEFEEAVFRVFETAIAQGVIGIKDQCAYNRTLAYDVVARSDAERLFNRILANPNALLGWTEAKPLDDYLFHQYMRFARDLDLPVQIHTGHMAGNYNRVTKANVAQFATVLELHQDVRFDLFHGNYPYMGDILFFAKNYPNVMLNFCWTHIIDPIYAEEMVKRVVMTVPHNKIFGYGGDYFDLPEYSVAHLKLGHEVMAGAFSDLVARRWLSEADASRIAADWLFHNPNRFYKLGLTVN